MNNPCELIATAHPNAITLELLPQVVERSMLLAPFMMVFTCIHKTLTVGATN